MRERYGVTVLGSLGFENAYALAMRRDRAAALGIRTIADLAPQTPRLTLGSDLEFLCRPEWTALRDAYRPRVQARSDRSSRPSCTARSQDGQVDVISAFSSDGRIAADDLVVLDDDKHAIPPYDAVILLAPKRAQRRGSAPRAHPAGRRHLRRDDAPGELHARPRHRQGLARGCRPVPRREILERCRRGRKELKPSSSGRMPYHVTITDIFANPTNSPNIFHRQPIRRRRTMAPHYDAAIIGSR